MTDTLRHDENLPWQSKIIGGGQMTDTLMPKELEGWSAYEALKNFDSFLTSETSELLFLIDDLVEAMLDDGRPTYHWWLALNPTQQSEIIYAYENFDPTNSRFEMDHQ